MNYKKLEQQTRDDLLKKELSNEKIRIIEKFGLKSTPDLYWISEKENAHPHIFFKHSFLKDTDIIGVLFRINRLCFAKVNYFRRNSDKFEPYKYDFQQNFIKTEWWDAEFLKHIASGFHIDMRYLQTITEIEKFIQFYEYLESFEGGEPPEKVQ